MKKRHHLAIGAKLGGHYEIVQVLGEDEFEILYLVKDLHMGEQKFLLKELFLFSYAFRDDENNVQVMAKSKQLFEQTKKDMIAEIELLKRSDVSLSPKVYGYFEEHHTLYTIMEFINSSNLSVYLERNEANVQDEKETPNEKEILAPDVVASPVKAAVEVEEVEVEKEKPKSKIFLKILIVSVLLLLVLFYYAYNMIQKDKERAKNRVTTEVTVVTEPKNNPPLDHPPLEDKTKVSEENLSLVVEAKEEPENKIPEGASYIEEGEAPLISVEALPKTEPVEVYEGSDTITDSDAINDLEERTYTQEEQIVIERPVTYEPNVVETPLPQIQQHKPPERLETPMKTPVETPIGTPIRTPIYGPKIIERPLPPRKESESWLGTRIN